jgi:large subunit ribosomal protein L37Ae
MARKNASSKRFGSRYGSRIRKNVDEAESTPDMECPECGSEKVSREAAGIWKCGKCGHKAAGGAYKRDTGADEILQKALQTDTEFEELEEAQEELEGEN